MRLVVDPRLFPQNKNSRRRTGDALARSLPIASRALLSSKSLFTLGGRAVNMTPNEPPYQNKYINKAVP